MTSVTNRAYQQALRERSQDRAMPTRTRPTPPSGYAKLPAIPTSASPVPHLTYHTKRLAYEGGLVPACTDIVRFSHGASSGRKVYRSSFIPQLHDLCMLFQKPRSLTTR